MKVILRADIENLGRLGDVVDVKPGFGRNYLLPQGLAMPASASNIKVFELDRKKLQAKMDALRAAAGDLSGRIEATEIIIPMRVGENDKLYGSVTTTMIASFLGEQGIEVDRHRILLDAPIRTLGEFELRVRLHADVTAKLKLKVVPEERSHDDSEQQQKQDEQAEQPESSTEEAAE